MSVSQAVWQSLPYPQPHPLADKQKIVIHTRTHTCHIISLSAEDAMHTQPRAHASPLRDLTGLSVKEERWFIWLASFASCCEAVVVWHFSRRLARQVTGLGLEHCIELRFCERIAPGKEVNG